MSEFADEITRQSDVLAKTARELGLMEARNIALKFGIGATSVDAKVMALRISEAIEAEAHCTDKEQSDGR